MKVLHLPFGAQMIVLCKALREIGIDATSCHFRRSKFNFKSDICLNLQEVPEDERIEKQREFFIDAVKEYDVFHFHFGETFLPDKSELQYLKKLGKKIVVQHRGSDVRLLDIARSLGNPYVRVKKRTADQIVSDLQRLSSHSDHAIVADHELLPYVQKYYKQVHIIRQAVELDKLVPLYPSITNEKPLIIHAPSHRRIKGTEFVLKAVKQLSEKGYCFQFQLIEDTPNDEAVKQYQQAQIVIDQLLIGSFGVFSLEAMAFGKPVICYIREGLRHKYPPNLPIINANPNNIYDKLKKLLRRPERWHQIGAEGRKYVEEHHDSLLIAKQLADLYNRL